MVTDDTHVHREDVWRRVAAGPSGQHLRLLLRCLFEGGGDDDWVLEVRETLHSASFVSDVVKLPPSHHTQHYGRFDRAHPLPAGGRRLVVLGSAAVLQGRVAR